MDVTDAIGYIFNCNGMMGCWQGVTTPPGDPTEWTDEEAGAYDRAQATAFLAALAERGLTVVGMGAKLPRPTAPANSGT